MPLAVMRVMGGAGEGVVVEGGAGVRGAAPARSRAQPRHGSGAWPRRGVRGGGALRLSRNELKIFHKQIVSRNEAT